MEFIRAFVVGGLFCVVAQILIDKTNVSPGRVLVAFVVLGCLAGGLGLYEPLVQYAGAGATVPLPGFGNALAKGVMREIDKSGFAGILTGGLRGTAGGITAALLFSLAGAAVFEPKAK